MAHRSSLTPLALLVIAAAGCTGPTGSAEDVGETAQPQVVCPDGEVVAGIDVSVWQQDVNWDAVASDGVKFAFARASYGTSKDTYFDQNWAGMKAAGLIRGAYQYWLPANDPIEQAQAMLDIVGPLGQGDLPPVVDVEQNDGLGPAEMTSRLTKWIQHVEAAIGRKPIIYSGKYFWQDNVQSDAFVEYPLWIPNYSLDCPDLASGYWTDWHFFQYTSTGSVAGVSGNVDRNQWNGTLQDLYAFADGGPKYAAEFVSQSFPYASQGAVPMIAGQSVELALEMKNTGTEPWNDGTLLGTTEPRDRESPFAGPEWPASNRYARVEGVVLPGETYTFTWKMHAPEEPGLYDEHMSLVQEGVAWFGDPGQGGPPDAQLEGLFEVAPGDGKLDGKIDLADKIKPGDDGDDGSDASAGCSAGLALGCSAGGDERAPGTGALLAGALGLAAAVRRRRRGA
jgi:lysozyme